MHQVPQEGRQLYRNTAPSPLPALLLLLYDPPPCQAVSVAVVFICLPLGSGLTALGMRLVTASPVARLVIQRERGGGKGTEVCRVLVLCADENSAGRDEPNLFINMRL